MKFARAAPLCALLLICVVLHAVTSFQLRRGRSQETFQVSGNCPDAIKSIASICGLNLDECKTSKIQDKIVEDVMKESCGKNWMAEVKKGMKPSLTNFCSLSYNSLKDIQPSDKIPEIPSTTFDDDKYSIFPKLKSDFQSLYKSLLGKTVEEAAPFLITTEFCGYVAEDKLEVVAGLTTNMYTKTNIEKVIQEILAQIAMSSKIPWSNPNAKYWNFVAGQYESILGTSISTSDNEKAILTTIGTELSGLIAIDEEIKKSGSLTSSPASMPIPDSFKKEVESTAKALCEKTKACQYPRVTHAVTNFITPNDAEEVLKDPLVARHIKRLALIITIGHYIQDSRGASQKLQDRGYFNQGKYSLYTDLLAEVMASPEGVPFQRTKDTVVFYRGRKGFATKEEVFDKLKVGTVFREKWVNSVSSNREIAFGYSLVKPESHGKPKFQLMFMYKTNKGVDISPQSCAQEESIVPAGNFEVEKIELIEKEETTYVISEYYADNASDDGFTGDPMKTSTDYSKFCSAHANPLHVRKATFTNMIHITIKDSNLQSQQTLEDMDGIRIVKRGV